MTAGKNNPRVFAETITLDAWRTSFDGKRGEADLHIDVIFAEKGRVGGDNAPVRFRLSLRRAEVWVVRDSEGIIQINPESVMRDELPKPGKSRTTVEKNGTLGARAGMKLAQSGANAQLSVQASGKINVKETTETMRVVPVMQMIHWKTDTGYAFKIAALRGGLDGQPWNSKKVAMKLKDTNVQRTRGEHPEVRVEIHCPREDFIIEEIEFTDSSYPVWKKLPHLKRIAVEQYIKDELARSGHSCGESSDPFTRIILADIMPSAPYD